MIGHCTAAARLLAVAAAVAVLGTSALAVPTYNAISVMDGTQSGWREAAIYGATGGLSVDGLVCKGNPGPRPVGFYLMNCGQMGSGGGSGNNPGQAWIGTDKYNSLLLSQITTLKYWTIMDFRGGENDPVKDAGGVNVPGEYYPKWLDCQAPQIELFCRVDNNTNYRQFIYRPWSYTDPATQIFYAGYGPKDGSQSRKWQEWDCLHEGYWLEAIAGAPMETWDELKNKYPDAYLWIPTWTQTPVYAAPDCPVGDEFSCAALCVVLGARKQTNNDFSDAKGWKTWWKESWNAQGAVDKIIIGYNDTELGLIEDEYDFQSPTLATDASQNRIRALNNKALFDQNTYMPDPRTRGPINTSSPPPSWGGGSVDSAKMNAIQRAGTYNYEQMVTGYNPDGSRILGSAIGQVFALYGTVSDSATTANWFKVDDGSGKLVPCYCQNAQSVVQDGDFVRMVGGCYGQNPFEWYYNMFHMVAWNADPLLATYSTPWPMQFHTFDWNVEVLYRP